MTRQEIIGKIRRLAAEIERPPGSKHFESWAGLPAHHWRGVYWARWSEALREAGFEPNERQPKADPEVLLEQLAIATRQLGHCPTADELNVYQRTHTAPSPSTVRLHFGRRAVLLERLKRWAEAHPDYADVAILLAQGPAVAPGNGWASPAPPSGSAEAGGIVRLFRCDGGHRLSRVGDADGRQRSRPAILPREAVLEHAIRTDDPTGVEAYWRGRFAYRRIEGDWLALTPEDVAAFKRWKEI